MREAQDVAGGSSRPTDTLCYEPGDWEDGWFSDYAPGACFTRAELEHRVGMYSDNTAAHILVRAGGGGDALNAYARAHGASESEFWDPTSPPAATWPASGGTRHRPGGRRPRAAVPVPAADQHAYEDGIPAGVPSGTTVVHKIGILDGEINDAGLVLNGPARRVRAHGDDRGRQLGADRRRRPRGRAVRGVLSRSCSLPSEGEGQGGGACLPHGRRVFRPTPGRRPGHRLVVVLDGHVLARAVAEARAASQGDHGAHAQVDGDRQRAAEAVQQRERDQRCRTVHQQASSGGSRARRRCSASGRRSSRPAARPAGRSGCRG